MGEYKERPIIEKGEAVLISERKDSLTFRFSGRRLSGHWVFKAVPGKKISWVFKRDKHLALNA